ncbi:hypothetical protein Taro_042775 [Colocasia esculenta]|uniref:Syntaxin 6/10/61 N-terminal domain-containing protein n=1 Tax=Colocasia esculenta TaxID=4460 RepID=A0A843WJ83_COLES|nr:hypothetical protein [Colocasia esculenta]
MAGGSSIIRWESDPLFSAAEVVQDSADRMESFYRLLMHDWKLVCEENKDNKLLSSIHYHKRDLVTAVETTKWQMEDFERAVYFAALSDETGLRKNAISKHKQFIDAIREQIVSVEKYLEEISIGDSDRSMQWTHLNEPDSTGLALFLSGNDSMDHHLQHNSENTIMKRFFESTGSTDEIIELEPEEHLRVNDTRHLNHASNSSKDDKPWEFGSNYVEGHDLKSSCFPQEGVRENGFSRNFTKRRKDGEITDDHLVDIDGHSENVSSAEQCKQAFSFDVCHGLNYRGLASAMQVGKWLEVLPRRFNQSPGLSLCMNHMRSAFVVLITITIIGFLVFSLG